MILEVGEPFRSAFMAKCRRTGMSPEAVMRLLVRKFLNSGRRYAHGATVQMVENIACSKDIYHLLRAKFADPVDIYEFCDGLSIGQIDRSILVSVMGRKEKYSLSTLSKVFWLQSNIGEDDLYLLDEDDDDEYEIPHSRGGDDIVMLPTYEFFDVCMRSVRRRINACEFFAVKLHRWYSFGVTTKGMRHRQTSLCFKWRD